MGFWGGAQNGSGRRPGFKRNEDFLRDMFNIA